MEDSTNFRKQLAQITALAQLCNFSQPGALCTSAETYYRKTYDWMNKDFEKLVSARNGG